MGWVLVLLLSPTLAFGGTVSLAAIAATLGTRGSRIAPQLGLAVGGCLVFAILFAIAWLDSPLDLEHIDELRTPLLVLSLSPGAGALLVLFTSSAGTAPERSNEHGDPPPRRRKKPKAKGTRRRPAPRPTEP